LCVFELKHLFYLAELHSWKESDLKKWNWIGFNLNTPDGNFQEGTSFAGSSEQFNRSIKHILGEGRPFIGC
jgi:hypothetical protein